MTRVFSYFITILVFGLSFTGCGSKSKAPVSNPDADPNPAPAPAPEVINPVLPGDRPDPTVIKVGDTYWASATSNEWSPLFPIFKSEDLVSWELVTYVFPGGAPDWAIRNFWAPELSYDEEQGKVYAYYTARDKASDRLSVAVASADNPAGPYTDHGPLVAQELGSIDAYEARDKDGKLYLLWKEDGNSQGQPTPMWAQEITEDRTELVGERHELFRNDVSWEAHLVEGISIFQRGEYFYATYSAGSCCDVACDYKTGVARASSLLGPWEKYEQNPVLTDSADWKCPGHGSVVQYGEEFYFLYHAYSTEGSVYVGREAVLARIEWTEDGWPTFGSGTAYNREYGSWDFTDDFKSDLNPLWQWRVTQDIEYVTGADGLMLQASTENEGLGTLLVQPTSSPSYDISAVIGLTGTGAGAQGGIALIGGADNSFGAPVAGIGISAGQEAVQVWRTVNNETEILGETAVSGQQDVALRMQVRDGHNLTFEVKNGADWIVLAEGIDAAPQVAWGMGFRFGIVAKGEVSENVNVKEFKLTNI